MLREEDKSNRNLLLSACYSFHLNSIAFCDHDVTLSSFSSGWFPSRVQRLTFASFQWLFMSEETDSFQAQVTGSNAGTTNVTFKAVYSSCCSPKLAEDMQTDSQQLLNDEEGRLKVCLCFLSFIILWVQCSCQSWHWIEMSTKRTVVVTDKP